MKPLFLVFLLLVACGCDKAAKKDAGVLDAILANGGVDHIDCFGGPFGITNGYYDRAANLFLSELSATNRQRASAGSFLANRHRTVILFNGSQTIATLRYYPRQDLLVYGAYCFHLKSSTNATSDPFRSFDRAFMTY
jgi:hypothetical protein